MTNEFGAKLDRAGYAPSILHPMQPGRCCCYLCGRPANYEKMDRHEPYGGALRQKSKELGLWVELHHWGCHEGPGSAHGSGAVARQLRADAQRAAMLRYGWTREKWIEEFGKSELSEEECLELTKGPSQTLRASSPGGRAGNEGKRIAAPVCAPARNDNECGDAGASSRVAELIREFWPDHPTSLREGTRREAVGAHTAFGSGFRSINGPELPF